jgi:preprotein translocase subunit YajC
MPTYDTLCTLFFTLAEEAAPSGTQGPPPQSGGEMLISMLTMFVPLILIFYLLILRPENKRRKEREELLNSIKVKDRVVTAGGIFGTVMELDKDEATLMIDPNKGVKIRVRRMSIEGVEPSAKEKEAEKTEKPEDKEKDKK